MSLSRRRLHPADAGLSTFKTAFGLALTILVVVVGWSGLERAGIDLPNVNPFDDGHDGDDEASGSVRVEGQTPQTATDTLVVKIGEGDAVVSIKADQNWDRPGNITDGDFQSTNGTASVRDPDDHDEPARITVGVEYCAEAEITRSSETDGDGGTGSPDDDEITFDLNSLFVCDVEWLPTAENEAAFGQDDTPADFQGQFEELIKGAAVAAVAASECPETLAEEYSSDEFLDFLAESLAEREGVPADSVTVVPGVPGATSPEDQEALQHALDTFVEHDDLDIDAFSGNGTAVEDSCYIDTSGEPLSSLDEVQAPDPDDL